MEFCGQRERGCLATASCGKSLDDVAWVAQAHIFALPLNLPAQGLPLHFTDSVLRVGGLSEAREIL